jgi:hypothetical protein
MLDMRKKEATLGKVVLQRFLYGVDNAWCAFRQTIHVEQLVHPRRSVSTGGKVGTMAGKLLTPDGHRRRIVRITR